MQFCQAGGSRILARKVVQHLIQGHEQVRVLVKPAWNVGQGHLQAASIAFLSALVAGMIDENSPHGFGRGGEEVSAVLPTPAIGGPDEPQVSLVNQSSCIERVFRRLGRHSGCRKLPQLVVHEWEQVRGGLAVATRGGIEKARHI
jgi:hypothetical protein